MNETEVELGITPVPQAKAPAEAELPIYRQAIYNPGRLNDSEIKATYVARPHLLEGLLDDIRSCRPGSRPQHHLLVGQRGMGKTTLLCRIDVELRENPAFSGLLSLTFPEEQWTIDRLSKLWLNCLDSLADTLERESSDASAALAIDQAVDSLRAANLSEALMAEATEKELLEQARQLDRRLVLLVDNLDLVFSRLETHEQNRLRSVLMAPGAPILIGAAVSPPDETLDYSAPFYDQFKIHYLERLSLDEMQKVLRELAIKAGQLELLNRLAKEHPRLRTLHSLTGGNPRTTSVLFQIFAKGFSKEAYQDLEALLDWITPLYKARFEEMSAQSQLIVSALATHWEPASAAQLAEKTRLENRQISPQLDRLRKAGIVEVVQIDPEDRTGPVEPGASGPRGYQLAERFFNIWFLMRQASRRERRNLTFLTRFIECTLTPSERSVLARELLSRRPLSREESIYGLALEPIVSERSLRFALHDHVQNEIVVASRALKQKVDELVDPSEIPSHRYAFAELRTKLEAATPTDCGLDPQIFADTILGTPAFLDRRGVIADQKFDADRARELLATAETDFQLNCDYADEPAAEWFRNLLRLGTVVDLADTSQFREAILRAERWSQARVCLKYTPSSTIAQLPGDLVDSLERLAISDPEEATPGTWIKWAHYLRYTLNQFDAAARSYRRAIDHGSDSAFDAKLALADLLWRVDKQDEADQIFQESLEARPECGEAWALHALYLHYGKESPLEAESSYLKAIELAPNEWWTWANLADLYQYTLDRPDSARNAYQQALPLIPTDQLSQAAQVRTDFGNLLQFRLKAFDEAGEQLRSAILIDPSNDLALNNLGLLAADRFGDAHLAEELFTKAEAVNPTDSLAPRYNRISILRDQLGRIDEAERLFSELDQPHQPSLQAGLELHLVLFAAYQDNLERALIHLQRALTLISSSAGFPDDTFPAWMRTTAVLLHLGYGNSILELLRQRGDDSQRRPWYEAIRAHLRGDRAYLRNIPVEMREIAGMLYDEIETRLRVLPPSTRRWLPPGKQKAA